MKKVILALLLVACLVVSGCNLVEKDAEVDKTTTILKVNGVEIDKQTFNEAYNSFVYNSALMYSYYGLSFNEEETRKESRASVADTLIENEVKKQKATAAGCYDFTAEETAEIEEAAKQAQESDLAMVKTEYFADTTLEGDELTAAMTAKLEEFGFPMSKYVEDQQNTKALAKLKAQTVKDVVVTDEDIQTQFDENVAADKSNYDVTPANYGAAVNAFSDASRYVYYAPEGYRYIKRILVPFGEADQTALTEAKTSLDQKQTEVTDTQAAITALDTAAEDYQTKKDELDKKLAALVVESSNLSKAYNAAIQKAGIGVMDQVDAATARLDAGETFDAVMAEVNQDAKLKAEPLMSRGYAICQSSTDLESDIVSAAMGLAKAGDYTKAIVNSEGVSILSYVGDVPAGAIDLSIAREDISAELLQTKQDEAYDAAAAEWVKAAKVEKHLDRID